MKKSKLISLISVLDTREFRQLSEFVRSAYHNKDERLVLLFDYLEQHFPDFPEAQIRKKIVFPYLFPGEPYNDQKIVYLMSDLLKLVEVFLGLQHLKQEEVLFDYYILKALAVRNADKSYNTRYRKLKTKLEKDTCISSDQFYYQYLVSELAADYFGRKELRSFDENLQVASNALDDFYFINKLKYSCEMLNRQAILTDQYSISFLNEIDQHLNNRKELNPIITIYLQIYYSLLNPEEEKYFKALKSLITEYAGQLDREEMRGIYLYAINIGVRKLRYGKNVYMHSILDLYLEGIKTKILYDNNYLSHWTYDNVLKLALRLKKFDLFEQFIYEYHSELKPQFKEDALHYNLAEYYFQKKNYGEALYHLQKVKFSDLRYQMGARVLIIKTYYQDDAIEPLFSALASFTVYLKRDKKTGTSIRAGFLNFCNLLNQILKGNAKNPKALKDKIAATQPLPEGPWLMTVFKDTYPDC